jgi:DNA-binding CsgD family transcriptional regulator
MLLGRQEECARIDLLLTEAKTGMSRALVLAGDPGVGKSALIDYANERAAGMTLLLTRGVESESELAFSGLADLLRPVLDRLERIPRPQSAALSGALALGPAVPGDPFTIYAATLSVLASAAEEKPILLTVDDAHWLDAASRDALLFTARRLDAESIALLFAVRDGQAPSIEGDIAELRVAGLNRDAATALLAGDAVNPVAPDVANQLVLETEGNPLALREIPALLSDSQRAGIEPLPKPLPASVSVERAFLSSVEGLSTEAQTALLFAAASDSGAIGELVPAFDALGISIDVLEAAEGSGAISISGGEVRFRHPLMRSAIYHAASAADRRHAHQLLARSLGESHSPERSAWHLAAATIAPDEDVAQSLEQAALDARQRSGHGVAAVAFERAAELTPRTEPRALRLLEAARDFQAVGQLEHAAELLDHSLKLADEPRVRAEMHLLRARGEIVGGVPMAAHSILVAEASRIEALDPGRAALMLVEATFPCLMAAETKAALVTAEKAVALASRVGGAPEVLARAFLAEARMLRGEMKDDGAARLQPLPEGVDAAIVFPHLWAQAHVHMLSERYAQAAPILEGQIAAGRAASAPAILPMPLGSLSELEFRTGQWAAAYAHATESVHLAAETRQANQLAYCLAAALARVEAGQGRERECNEHLDEAVEVANRIGALSILFYAGSARALLALPAGAHDAAIAHLEPVARLADEKEVRDPGTVQWEPDLVEAYVRAGRSDDASTTLSNFRKRAKASGRIWALAAAHRCAALLADENEFEPEFAMALSYHDRTPTPFERARTELCFGERLRRARRRTEARSRLRSALTIFDHLGAKVWAERAQAELAASGESARQRDPSTVDDLTPQELQVALVVARGASNREAAAALFLSPKTIEFHLGHVYRKLGIKSRSQLARLFAERATETAA